MNDTASDNRPGAAGTRAQDYTDFGRERVPVQAKQGRVERVFTSVAWLAPGGQRDPYRHLDVAGGTGDIAYRVLRAGGPNLHSVVLDINEAMLTAGRRRPEAGEQAGRLAFSVGDAERLPLPDRSVDAYTIGFGIRNVTRIDQALREAHRVLRHGGRFLCLEFSEVSVPIVDSLYEAYSETAIPLIGQVVTGDRAAYRYLVDSIRAFPPQEEFAAMLRDAGFERVAWRDLTGGVAALHSGWRL